jgi:hypothetical protein
MTIEHLVAELDAVGAVPLAWRKALLAVPRHLFLPSQIWVDDEHGNPQPLSRDDNPDRWLAAAYRNVPILTQFDDGKTVWPDTTGELCTSPASKPELMLRMLTALDVRDGHHVLEIGTGTGYHAALLAARLGAPNVTTMEIDFGGSVPLVRFSVNEDGTATGRPVGRVGFMAVRSHRTPEWTIDHIDPNDPRAEVSTSTLKPWRVAENHDVRWAIGTRVPRCVWEHQPPTGDRRQHLLWLLDPGDGSWAVARYDDGLVPDESASTARAVSGTRSRPRSAPGPPPGNHPWIARGSPFPPTLRQSHNQKVLKHP